MRLPSIEDEKEEEKAVDHQVIITTEYDSEVREESFHKDPLAN